MQWFISLIPKTRQKICGKLNHEVITSLYLLLMKGDVLSFCYHAPRWYLGDILLSPASDSSAWWSFYELDLVPNGATVRSANEKSFRSTFTSLQSYHGCRRQSAQCCLLLLNRYRAKTKTLKVIKCILGPQQRLFLAVDMFFTDRQHPG